MYTKIESIFWKDTKMRAISSDARMVMLYLLTSPHRNILGFYFLPSPYACFDLDWDEQRFVEGLRELVQIGRVRYDKDTHMVLVINYLKHNPLENPNQVKSAIDKFNELPETPLFTDFLEVLSSVEKPFIEPLRERLRERLPQPVTVTVTVTGTVKEQDQKIFLENCGFAGSMENEPEEIDNTDNTDFNFPERYWEMTDSIDSLPQKEQLDMLVVQYGIKFPVQRKEHGTAGTTTARKVFQSTLAKGVMASEVLKEILYDVLEEGEKEPTPWDIANRLSSQRGLEQTRSQMHYNMALQLEKGVLLNGAQRDPPVHRCRNSLTGGGTIQTGDSP